jgi:NhaP-type Na+/H+ or K+/H+ antiporter
MVFLLNGLVFVLIGLQLPRILHTPSGQSLKQPVRARLF